MRRVLKLLLGGSHHVWWSGTQPKNRIVRCFATEIDPYAARTSLANFPENVHLGNAFQVRTHTWTPPR